MYDCQAYLDYPKARHLYNKLWLSEKLGYHCGPSGVAPDRPGWFMVRPIMNLSGMGVGAKKQWIDAGDYSKVPPGYFWVEFLEGRHLSITYNKSESNYIIQDCYEGFKDHEGQFIEWLKVNDTIDLPKWIKKELCNSNIKTCNAEFIGTNLIEMHLRNNPDPNAESLFPVWEGSEIIVDKLKRLGYSYIDSYDNADGFLERPRLGFMIKKVGETFNE
jgi:hypothetical protein